MKHQKNHKKELSPKPKDKEWDLGNRGKNADQKVKYKHKNHWLEDDMDEIVPIKIKKKKKLD